MIRLYQLPPLDRVPSLSPFCMKVETYLRMTGLPYEAVTVVEARQGPKKKVPYIDVDGRRIGDSGLIIEYLAATKGDNLDARLSKRERATGHAVRRMLEEHFYWALVYARWFDDVHWRRLYPVFFPQLPRPLHPGLAALARQLMKRTMYQHGIGRHSSHEIFDGARRDVDALAEHLADKPYLLGDAPSSYDAIAYAFVANVLDVEMETPVRAAMRGHANLVSYNERMGGRYYPDRMSAPSSVRVA